MGKRATKHTPPTIRPLTTAEELRRLRQRHSGCHPHDELVEQVRLAHMQGRAAGRDELRRELRDLLGIVGCDHFRD